MDKSNITNEQQKPIPGLDPSSVCGSSSTATCSGMADYCPCRLPCGACTRYGGKCPMYYPPAYYPYWQDMFTCTTATSPATVDTIRIPFDRHGNADAATSTFIWV